LFIDKVTTASWGKLTGPKDLHINWHVPSLAEIEFAVELFSSQAETALETITALLTSSSKVKRDGTGKEWSDDMSRNLVLLRLLLAGIAYLVNTEAPTSRSTNEGKSDVARDLGVEMDQEQDATLEGLNLGEQADDEIQPSFTYACGYFFQDNQQELYTKIHALRDRIGQSLHEVHVFLIREQQDDVACFNALYTVC